ncbi:MAG: hypothetical protein R3C60_09630 [Parvularculaceae bacterium]
MRVIFLLALIALAACARDDESDAPLNVVTITIEASAVGPWRATYELTEGARRLDFGPSRDHYRETWWRVEGNGVRLVTENGRDFVISADGKTPFRNFSVSITPAASARAKSYEPFIGLGAGGQLFYTGHFIPYQERFTRMATHLTVAAPEGAAVTGFGETKPAFTDWESPYRNPAFLYVGKVAPKKSASMELIVDDAAPLWIDEEISEFAPKIAATLAKLLGRDLLTTPDIFLAMGDVSEEGRVAYSGDALPGQYQMTLAGGGWLAENDFARRLLRRSTAHEAAHLWQAAVRPRSDAVPDWIHEGGASALAREALIEAGYWTADDAAADLQRARAECASGLAGASLDRAEAAHDWPTVYACGEIANIAAAGDQGSAAFWREFMSRAASGAGYDEAMFVDLARERGGGAAADAIRELSRINNADAGPVIDRMLAR